jgi:hypothetical protein
MSDSFFAQLSLGVAASRCGRQINSVRRDGLFRNSSPNFLIEILPLEIDPTISDARLAVVIASSFVRHFTVIFSSW